MRKTKRKSPRIRDVNYLKKPCNSSRGQNFNFFFTVNCFELALIISTQLIHFSDYNREFQSRYGNFFFDAMAQTAIKKKQQNSFPVLIVDDVCDLELRQKYFNFHNNGLEVNAMKRRQTSFP
jgi:hypothetical protein